MDGTGKPHSSSRFGIETLVSQSALIGHGADIGGPRTPILASHHLFPLSESMQGSRYENPLRKESEALDIPDAAASLMALHRTVFDSGPFENPLTLPGIRLNLNVRNHNGQTLPLLAAGG